MTPGTLPIPPSTTIERMKTDSKNVKLSGDTVADVAFQGEGCAISKASASLMTEAIKQKTRGEALSLFSDFHDLVTGSGSNGRAMGKLAVFSNVSKFPIRVKCAMLAWRALESALAGQPGDRVVTTE
jgi:nitrogen fixation NifU-like protein